MYNTKTVSVLKKKSGKNTKPICINDLFNQKIWAEMILLFLLLEVWAGSGSVGGKQILSQ